MHAWDLPVRVGPGDLEVDVAIELLEALLAGQLRAGRTDQGIHEPLASVVRQSPLPFAVVQAQTVLGEVAAQLSAGVVECLVERPARGC